MTIFPGESTFRGQYDRIRREQELRRDRDHVGSHVGSAHDLESRCTQVLGPLRDTDQRDARPARCSPNVPTLSLDQPSCSAITRPAPLEGQVIDDANLFLRNCKSGWTSSTTTALKAFLAATHLTSAFVRKPKTRCHRPSSVAQSDERAHRAIR
jgi:hypothetical protein